MRLALINRGGGLDFLKDRLQDALPSSTILTWPDDGAADAEVAVCWDPPHGLLRDMPNLRLIHSIGAGVDKLMADPALPDLPVCRIRDHDLAQAMGEYCMWATIWFQRQFDRVVGNAAARRWERYDQRPASETPVCILGLGAIGLHVAGRLHDAGYPVRGWSHGPHEVDGVACFHSPAGLEAALSGAMVVICLLPLTPSTRGILNAALFNRLPDGAGLVLCSRGEHLVHADLQAALRSGRLRGAVLDVFDTEPLPADDPLWSEPGVLVTPHMAALTKPRRIAEQIAENVRRLSEDLPLCNLVDRAKGY